jgi:hypothetical protein
VPFLVPNTLLKLPARPDGGAPPRAGMPVIRLNLHEFVKVMFHNTENELQYMKLP